MWIILISIAIALVIAFIVSKISSTNSTGEVTSVDAPPADCCGAHEICDKESLISHTQGTFVYYDDEELDVFKGKAPDQYSDKEIDQFNEVLYTMKPDDVPGWLKSLMARNIKLPLNVREAALAIIKQQRA